MIVLIPTNLVPEIPAASMEQNNGTNQIIGAVKQLKDVTEQYTATSEELTSNVEDMNAQAGQLNKLIAFFKVNENVNGLMKALEDARYSFVQAGWAFSGLH